MGNKKFIYRMIEILYKENKTVRFSIEILDEGKLCKTWKWDLGPDDVVFNGNNQCNDIY